METIQTELPGKLAALAKCAHDGCTCTVESGEQFCSDYCIAQAGGEESLMADGGCQCGHPECEHTMAVPVGVLTGLEVR
jgi:hypothetical protein